MTKALSHILDDADDADAFAREEHPEQVGCVYKDVMAVSSRTALAPPSEGAFDCAMATLDRGTWSN